MHHHAVWYKFEDKNGSPLKQYSYNFYSSVNTFHVIVVLPTLFIGNLRVFGETVNINQYGKTQLYGSNSLMNNVVSNITKKCECSLLCPLTFHI